jgi:lipopolysaccharide export system protein LptC
MTDIAEKLEVSFRNNRSSHNARKSAFEAAKRHSLRVRRLRRAIPLVAIAGGLLLMGIVLVDPFRTLPANVSVSRAGLNGSHIVMDLPKLSGFRKDGREYDVTATSAVQDITKPTIIELNDPDAKVVTAESGTVHVTAQFGTYNSMEDVMALRSNVHLRTESGYDAVLRSATIDLKAGTMVSNEPVNVVMNNGTIAADSLQILDNGRIIFSGKVRTVFNPSSPSGNEP